tara:strand:- start:493 stop:1434 length:942 start_codon:yes stop_codon:yes gene_type:complete
MKTPTQIVYDDDISLQTVHIDIELGNLCNWACTYCPKKSHDGSIPWVDKNNLIKFLDQACTHYKSLGKKYFDFNFLGGEPTLFKHFVEITNWIKQQDFYSNVEMMTNGYRKMSYWEKNIKSFDTVSITHHAENADPLHTKTVADFVVDNGKYASVSIPMIPWEWDKCMEHIETLMHSKHPFNVSPKTLLKDFGGKNIPYDYTDNQKKILNKKFRFNQLSNKHKKYRKGINATKLVANQANRFLGYTCYAGIDIISINKVGGLRLGGNCYVQHKGFTDKKYYDDNIAFPQGPTICTQKICSCLPDVQTRKYINA